MRKRKDTLTAYLFLAPALLIFLVLIVYPIFFSGYVSFTKWKFTSGLKGMQWIGVKNYANLFKDKYFVAAIKNTFIYTFGSVPISVGLSLVLAYVLNNKVYCAKILRMFYFIPYIAQMVAVAAIFRSWFRTDGFINNMLINLFGVAEENVPKWLANSTLSRIPVLLLLIWSSLGYLIIVYMGALQNVPVSLYEAAEIDGANKTQQFRHITIPLVSQTTFYLLIVRMIAVFKVFTSVNVLTWKTSSKGSVSIVQEVYSTAFGDFNFGKGSAQSWVLVGIILIFTFIQFKGQKKWVHY